MKSLAEIRKEIRHYVKDSEFPSIKNMKTTRQKRPDRVICKWGEYEVELGEDGEVWVWAFPKSEIPNLIKALEEIQK